MIAQLPSPAIYIQPKHSVALISPMEAIPVDFAGDVAYSNWGAAGIDVRNEIRSGHSQ